MITRRKVRLICISALFALMTMGCITNQRLAKITRQEREVLRSGHIPATVEVRAVKGESLYSVELLAKRLKRTGVFDEVELAGKLKRPPDLILESHREEETPDAKPREGASSDPLPVFMIVSLGIIPEIYKDFTGVDFDLYAAEPPNEKIEIEQRWYFYTVMGFAAIPVAVLPGWRWLLLPWNLDRRYYDHLALEILKHRNEIVEVLRSAERD